MLSRHTSALIARLSKRATGKKIKRPVMKECGGQLCWFEKGTLKCVPVFSDDTVDWPNVTEFEIPNADDEALVDVAKEFPPRTPGRQAVIEALHDRGLDAVIEEIKQRWRKKSKRGGRR